MRKHTIIGSAALGLVFALMTSGAASAQNLGLTVAFIDAGGYAGGFSSIRAMDSAAGTGNVQAGLQDLVLNYGSQSRNRFVSMFDYAMNDGWQRAGQDNLNVPASNGDWGNALGVALIRSGSTASGAFRTRHLFTTLWGPQVEAQIASDLNEKFGPGSAADFERMGNRFFFDLANDLGVAVALAPNH